MKKDNGIAIDMDNAIFESLNIFFVFIVIKSTQ